MEESTEQKSYGYGKRPLWQWIVLYLVIAIVLYGLVYYFYFSKKGGYSSQTGQYRTQQAVSPTVPEMMAPSGVASTSGDIVMPKTDATKGTYLAGFRGMTLYIFDKDKAGVSNCTDNCAIMWPPYAASKTASSSSMPINITQIKRADGSMQYALKGMPLYYYTPDKKPGDTTGDGVGGTWHLAKP